MKPKHNEAKMALLLLTLAIIGCSRFQQSQQSRPASQPEQPRPEQQQQGDHPPAFPPSANPETQRPAAADSNGDPSLLYGAWTSDSSIAGMACRSEFIFESTGTYSTLATCDSGYGGSYMTRSVGNWRLIQPGMVRIQYTDHEPKEFGGNPIRYPDGETMTFTVRDQNHLDTSAGVLTREL